MGGDHSFYEGAKSLTTAGGFTSEYALSTIGYQEPAHSFGLTTHPNNANVLKEVADKINSGIKAIEITAISPQILEAIPTQHLDEIRRLKELTGVELTFHGPIVEASGIERGRFDALAQKKAEREMFQAIESAQRLDPKGNTIVTFHSASAGLPELQTFTKDKEGVQAMYAWDESEKRIVPVPVKPNYLEEGNKVPNPAALLEQVNKANWESGLNNASFYANRGRMEFESVRRNLQQAAAAAGSDLTPDEIIEVYKNFSTPESRAKLSGLDPAVRQQAELALSEINHGELSVRQAYNQMKELYNQAYEVVKDDADRKKLEAYQKEIEPYIKEKKFEDPSNVMQLAEEVTRGLQLLSTLKDKPQVYKPAHDVVISKSSDTFSEVALKSFKKYGEHAPIISIENPPAGSSGHGAGGLARGKDIKELVEKTRDQFVEKVMKDPELQLSRGEAEKQAEKLIGVTWDVGHINMIRQFGYGEKDVLKESEHVAKMVKHVHLSDNFGINHTELPMGMGNVPTKEHLELIGKYNKQAKKIIETGDWWNHFKRNPFPETLQAFGSPIYAMKMSPYWNQARGIMGSYLSGFGMNPDHHHQIYGSGFSNLPVELGGQMSGKNRLSGAPME